MRARDGVRPRLAGYIKPRYEVRKLTRQGLSSHELQVRDVDPAQGRRRLSLEPGSNGNAAHKRRQLGRQPDGVVGTECKDAHGIPGQLELKPSIVERPNGALVFAGKVTHRRTIGSSLTASGLR